MTDILTSLLANAPEEHVAPGGQSLSASDAERLVEQLRSFSIKDVGSQQWHAQREAIAKLNMQAHINAATHSEEFVVESLVSLDKMSVLVHDLLVIESWKLHVLPHLCKHLAHKVEMTMSYLVLHHECIVGNLLEVTLFHTHALEALAEGYLLELADWTYRKLAFLNSPEGRAAAGAGQRGAQKLLQLSPEEELADKAAEVSFGAAMLALTILRYLTDHVTRLPLGLLGRLLATNDTPMVLAPLVDDPPWVRRRGKGKSARLEKWVNNEWRVVEAADRLRITQADGQVWLALNNLIVEPQCRAKYAADEWRRERLGGLRRHMNELLFDQLPVLRDLQRVLDEMALGQGAPDAGAQRSAALILEAVPGVRDALLREAGEPKQLALEQARSVFNPEQTRRLASRFMDSLLQQMEALARMEPPTPAIHDTHARGGAAGGAASEPGDSAAGAASIGPIRVSVWRKAPKVELNEVWCDLELVVEAGRAPEAVTLEELKGLRYRLQPLDPATTRALPMEGKVVVKLGSSAPLTSGPLTPSDPPPGPLLMAEALLQLPEVAVRSAAGQQPPVIWLNIGLLAEDGLVLQLKLRRTAKPVERDTVSGGWFAYQPCGGAVTVLEGVLEEGAGDVRSSRAGRGRRVGGWGTPLGIGPKLATTQQREGAGVGLTGTDGPVTAAEAAGPMAGAPGAAAAAGGSARVSSGSDGNVKVGKVQELDQLPSISTAVTAPAPAIPPPLQRQQQHNGQPVASPSPGPSCSQGDGSDGYRSAGMQGSNNTTPSHLQPSGSQGSQGPVALGSTSDSTLCGTRVGATGDLHSQQGLAALVAASDLDLPD